jgi:hypothetical protein
MKDMFDKEEKKYIEKVFLKAKELWKEDSDTRREQIETTAGAVYRIGKVELKSDIEPIIKMSHGE